MEMVLAPVLVVVPINFILLAIILIFVVADKDDDATNDLLANMDAKWHLLLLLLLLLSREIC
jgi:hypothetical protein